MKLTAQIFKRVARKQRLLFLFVFHCLFGKAQVASISGTINIYAAVTNVAAQSVTVSSSVGFSACDKVLIIQMKGASIDSTNAISYGNVVSYNNSGNYELALISTVSANVITFASPLLRAYTPSELVQLVRVPVYNSVSVTGLLGCAPWNGATGGVLAFEATGNVSMNANIDISGRGFSGGALTFGAYSCTGDTVNYLISSLSTAASHHAKKGEGIYNNTALTSLGKGKNASGGGGGNDINAGGAGGSNYGYGGHGGNVLTSASCPSSFVMLSGGIGGQALNYSNAANKIFLGGGGGAGHENDNASTPGANGGGIVLIRAASINGNGNTISANGNVAPNIAILAIDGQGGGGAGGTVLLDCPIIFNCTLSAQGGSGASDNYTGADRHGTGGGGAGGIVWTPNPIGVATLLNGGVAGVYSSLISPYYNTTFGATAGQSGGSLAGLSVPGTLGPPPAAFNGSLTTTGSMCQGSISISANTTVSPASYSWTGAGIANPATIFSITVNSPGTYSCIISNNCTAPQTLTVSITTASCISVSSSSITCASLGSATVSPIAGSGPYSYTWMPTGQTSSVATGLNPGTYTVIFNDAGNNITSTATTVFTSLIPLTGTLHATPGISCNGAATGTANVTSLAGGSGTQDYLWSNGINTYTVPNPVNLGAGSWSSTVTDALTGCTINNTFVITQPPALTLNVAANTPTACAGSSIALSGTNSGGTPGYTYSWTAGPATSINIVSQVTGGAYIYTLGSTDANNCLISNTILVSFVNNPNLSIANASICPLETGTLIASGAITYTWNNNNAATGGTFTSSPFFTTVYTVTGSALGCTSIATASIVLKATPIPALGTNGPLCNGDQLLLNAGGGTSYLWSGPAGFNSALQNPTISPVGLGNAGVYNLTVTAANSCTAPASATLLVNSTPTLIAMGSTACTSQTLSLTASSFAGAAYLWLGPLSFTSSLQNISISSPSISQSGVYTVVATSVAGCTNSAVALVSIVAPPFLSLALSSNSFCAQAFNGSPNTITLTSSGANTYTLSTPNHISNPNPSGPLSPVSMIPPYQPTGPATATLLGSNGVCTASTSLSFTIIPNPNVSISSATPVICSGQSYTYTSSGASSYTWSTASPGNTLYSIGNIAVANPSINSVFSVAGSSLGCSSAIQSSSITVNPLPVVTVNPNPALVCLGNGIELVASGTAASYSWVPGSWLNTTSSATVIAAVPALQNYNYTVTGSLNNCTVSALATVSVMPLPVATISTNTQKVCMNGLIVLNGSGGGTYSWAGPSGLFLSGQQMQSEAFSTASSGIYTLTVSDQNNCKGSATKSITVYNLPQGYFDPLSLEGCAPFCTDLNFNVSPASSSVTAISWQVNQQDFTGSNFKYCFNNPGNYGISGTLTDVNNCVNTITTTVNVYPRPTADFSYFPEFPAENLDEVIFTNTSQGPRLTQWSWNFINSQGYHSTNEDVSYLFTDAGNYPVAMVVKNAWGCSDSVVKTITVKPDFAVYVPNAFTPNGDGVNEWFGPVCRGATIVSFSIFNRWGEKIFESSGLQKGWDGSFKGDSCQQDIYVWKLSVSSQTGESKNFGGQVLLYR